MVPSYFADITRALSGFVREGDVKDAIRPKNGGPCVLITKIFELPEVSNAKSKTVSKRSEY